jgi:hypothetical protein
MHPTQCADMMINNPVEERKNEASGTLSSPNTQTFNWMNRNGVTSQSVAPRFPRHCESQRKNKFGKEANYAQQKRPILMACTCLMLKFGSRAVLAKNLQRN